MYAKCREIVERVILQACEFRHWPLHAMSVLTNHVHLVVSALVAPERVLSLLKARATRCLREVCPELADFDLWARHGSTRHLNDAVSLQTPVQYVMERQGADITA